MNIQRFFSVFLYSLGSLMLAFGGYQALQAYNLTGYVVLGDIGQATRGILIISLVIGGLLVCMAAKQVYGRKTMAEIIADAKLEQLEKRVLPRILVSDKAIQRVENDPTARVLTSHYLDQIQRIAERVRQNPSATPETETIGEFKVSPRGRSNQGYRIAWGYDSRTNTLSVYDLLYEVASGVYVDDWNRKAKETKPSKRITRTTYGNNFVNLDEARKKLC